MRSRRASPLQLRIIACCLVAFAVLLWGMAILFPGDHISLNGHLIKKGDTGFRWYMMTWRIAMGFGGILSLAFAAMCHSLSRKR